MGMQGTATAMGRDSHGICRAACAPSVPRRRWRPSQAKSRRGRSPLPGWPPPPPPSPPPPRRCACAGAARLPRFARTPDRTDLFFSCFLVILILTLVGPARAHQDEAPFSWAIIEPLEIHHAHIEDEQKLGQRIARAGPGQGFIVAPSLELLFERERFAGETETATAVLPGLQLWDVESGWQLGLGVKLPTGGHREADAVYLLQFRNHVDW